MNETQFEMLKKIEELYSEIYRITTHINLENDESEQILVQRESLLNEVTLLQKNLSRYPLGATYEQVEEIKHRIKSRILSVMADSTSLLEQAQILHANLKEKIANTQGSNRAAQGYAAHKRV
jgi:hypothetical protein